MKLPEVQNNKNTPPVAENAPTPKGKRWVSKKKKKIIPTGGKRAKKIKNKDVDNRRDKKKLQNFVWLIFLLVILSFLGLGIKNTFFPDGKFTVAEIQKIVKSTVGDTGFPLEKGRAYSQEFLYNYLNSTDDKGAQEILNRFYTGSASNSASGSSSTGKSVPSSIQSKTDDGQMSTSQVKVAQKPALMPILFEEKAISSYSAIYKYSVYMTNTDGSTRNAENDLTGSWMSFSVSVYYDKSNDTVSIVEAPTVVPTYAIKKPDQLPKERALGNGREDTKALTTLTPTIHGFIKAYALSSTTKHDIIDQYITDPKNPDLTAGLGGTMQLENDVSSIKKTVYDTDDQNTYKVDVTVTWQNIQVTPKGSGVSFTSHYVMTIQNMGNGVYRVSSFKPYMYVKEN